jgi:hypothetical protein
MDEKRIKRLENLERVYLESQKICNPLEFALRQNNLTKELAIFLLDELSDHRKSAKEEEEGNNE